MDYILIVVGFTLPVLIGGWHFPCHSREGLPQLPYEQFVRFFDFQIWTLNNRLLIGGNPPMGDPAHHFNDTTKSSGYVSPIFRHCGELTQHAIRSRILSFVCTRNSCPLSQIFCGHESASLGPQKDGWMGHQTTERLSLMIFW